MAEEKRGRGRPSKLTPDLAEKFCELLRGHVPANRACWGVGISPATYHSWMVKGERALKKAGKHGAKIEPRYKKYADFLIAVKGAQTVSIQRLVELIAEHGKKNWLAAAWLLERVYPDAFSRMQRVEHSGKGGMPIEVSSSDKKAAAQALQKALAFNPSDSAVGMQDKKGRKSPQRDPKAA